MLEFPWAKARALAPSLALLAGCAGAPPASDLPRWDAPELQARVEALRCEVARDCADFPVLLVDRGEAQAELLYDGRLAIRRGLVEATRDASELAFVIAHEIAHRHRQHRAVADLGLRLPLELEADADAQARLCALGMPANAGRDLLRRLWPADAEADSGQRTAAAQIEARIAALGECPGPAGAHRAAADPGDWQALLQRAGAGSPPAE